jgi:galactonate dehydratase
VPVWDLLGGNVRDKIKVYAWIGGDRPSDVEVATKARLSQKFAAVTMDATGEISMKDAEQRGSQLARYTEIT